MDADKYLSSVKFIFVFLCVLIAPGILLFLTQASTVVNINRGVAVLSIRSVYDALAQFTFHRVATNRDVLSIYAGDFIASLADMPGEQIIDEINLSVPNGGFEGELSHVFYLGEFPFIASPIGYCRVIAIQAAPDAPDNLATLTFPHEKRMIPLHRDDTFLLNFSTECGGPIESMLLVKDNRSPSEWLLAISQRAHAATGILYFLSAHSTCLGSIKVRKEWFTKSIDPEYQPNVRVEHRYEIVDRHLASESILYCAKLNSGITRHSDEIQNAIQDIVNNDKPKISSAIIGPLSMDSSFYLMVMPWIATVMVYMAKRRMTVLEIIAERVDGPWILRDKSTKFDWVASVIWCLWPLLAIIVAYGIYSAAFHTGLSIMGIRIDWWALIGLDAVDVLRTPPLVEGYWVEFVNWYSRLLLIGFGCSVVLGWQTFKAGRRIMRTYTMLVDQI
jgi:hypothetical protein